MIWRLGNRAVPVGARLRQHLAILILFDQVRAEFVATSDVVANGLKRFDVEISAGEIALYRAVGGDQEGGLAAEAIL
jgi:hypothetical protein